MIVVAGDSHDLGAVNFRAQNLGRLEVGRNKDAGFKALACCLRRYRIGEVAGRRTANDLETEMPGLGQGNGHHAIFKAECGKTDGIVFKIKRLAVEFVCQAGCSGVKPTGREPSYCSGNGSSSL